MLTLLTLKRKVRQVTVFFGLLSMFYACDEPCTIGSPCDTACEPGAMPICVTESICRCVGMNTAGTEGGMSIAGTTAGDEMTGNTEPPPVCEPLVLGDLIINEVMIDPDNAEPANEYVELVNVSDKEIDLTGVNLTYNDDEKFRFYQGCMPAHSAVAAYSGGSSADILPWTWSSLARGIGVYNYRYQFVNGRDFNFTLYSAEGQVLSQFMGTEDLIKEGHSLTRAPELIGEPLKHQDASTTGDKLSPARCANGGSYEANCTDSSTPIAGEMAGNEAGTEMGGAEIAGEMAGTVVEPPNCASPFIGDLLINELMIDAVGDENIGEFIEILNQSNQAVNLAGIELKYQNSSGVLNTEITFPPGCMAPHSAVVIYNNTRDLAWQWSTPTSDSSSLSTGHSPFALANSRDAVLELRASSGQLLSQISVLRSEITEGVSANRSPDGIESSDVTRHDTLSTNSSSPGIRPDGTRYEDR